MKEIRQLRPEDYDNNPDVDSEGFLPCWIEVGKATAEKWCREDGFPEGTVFSGWGSAKKDELLKAEKGVTYWTWRPTAEDLRKEAPS